MIFVNCYFSWKQGDTNCNLENVCPFHLLIPSNSLNCAVEPDRDKDPLSLLDISSTFMIDKRRLLDSSSPIYQMNVHSTTPKYIKGMKFKTNSLMQLICQFSKAKVIVKFSKASSWWILRSSFLEPPRESYLS